MPVNSTHPAYDAWKDRWKKCRDTAEGEEAIKEGGALYLPVLSGMTTASYDAYKNRALFYAAMGRTVSGLSGAILRKDPEVTWPEADKDLLDDLGVEGQSLDQLLKAVTDEVLTVGRAGVLVDAPAATPALPTPLPYVAYYFAENVLSWRTELVNGQRILTRVVLKECTPQENPKDPWEIVERVQYRVLHLGTSPAIEPGETPQLAAGFTNSDIESSFYYQEVWEETEGATEKDRWVLVDRIVPRAIAGKLFRFIPFTFVGPSGTESEVEKPPLLDLANVNLSHYRTSADLEHGRHFTALPTPWVAGAEVGATLKIGSGTAWVMKDPQARAGMLEFTGKGLEHLSKGLQDKERLMAVLGARLLEEQKAGVEAAATVALRHAGEKSALANIAQAVSEAFTLALYWVHMWRSPTEVDVAVELNRDYNLIGLDPQTLEKLMAALQGGMISWATWVYNLARGEVLPPGVSAEQEAALIGEGIPAPMGIPSNAPNDLGA